jgi:hypothetical protein
MAEKLDAGLKFRCSSGRIATGQGHDATRLGVIHWALLGTVAQIRAAPVPAEKLPQSKSSLDSRASSDGRGGFRTCDLSRVKRALSH